MRVFTAIELDPKVKDYLRDVQMNLRKSVMKGRFTDSDNFHLTLNFLGNLDPSQILTVKNAIRNSISNIRPFELCLSTLGNFNKRNKSVLWIGVDGEINPLKTLQRQLSDEFHRLDLIDRENNYTPHITLGRECVLVQDVKDVNFSIMGEVPVFTVNKVTLMESRRENGRLRYIPLSHEAL